MRADPAARGRGVGRLLVGEFFGWALGKGAEQASVTAYAANEAAQRFYRACGFAPHSVTQRAPIRP